jgi:Asparaginase
MITVQFAQVYTMEHMANWQCLSNEVYCACYENTGTGSVLNANGEVEMDAAIMSGRDLRAGSVACVHNIAHPISLAKRVMDEVNGLNLRTSFTLKLKQISSYL